VNETANNIKSTINDVPKETKNEGPKETNNDVKEQADPYKYDYTD
jgi:hypothetical protein